jgi:hypothetical protein
MGGNYRLGSPFTQLNMPHPISQEIREVIPGEFSDTL